MPQWQINEYENNAKNAPKIDFFYTGAIPQPPGIVSSLLLFIFTLDFNTIFNGRKKNKPFNHWRATFSSETVSLASADENRMGLALWRLTNFGALCSHCCSLSWRVRDMARGIRIVIHNGFYFSSNVVVVYLGGINRSTNEELKEITVISNNLIVHSAYNSRKISNDIALIRFDQPVSFSNAKVKPRNTNKSLFSRWLRECDPTSKNFWR